MPQWLAALCIVVGWTILIAMAATVHHLLRRDLGSGGTEPYTPDEQIDDGQES